MAKKTTKKKASEKAQSRKKRGNPNIREVSKKTQWKPGKSANPNGRPRLPEHVKKLRKANRSVITEIFSNLGELSYEDLLELEKNKSLSPFQLGAIAVMIKAIDQGDQNKLNFCIEQSSGKLPDIVQQQTELSVKNAVKDIPSEKLTQIADEYKSSTE